MVATRLINTLREVRVVPVIREADPEVALIASRELVAAGARSLEITFTTPQADEVLGTLKREYPTLPIGAGTLNTAQEAMKALLADADFYVSPCWSAPMAQEVINADKAYLPGAATPGEAWHHWQAGASLVKVFPAKSVGGPGFLKSLVSVFPDIPFMPTGGIGMSDAQQYLAAGAVCVGMGGKLIPSDDLAAGRLEQARTSIRAAFNELGLTPKQKEET